MKKISIVVPVFNEQKNIEAFFNNLSFLLKKNTEKYSFELIFVDDGSLDDSYKIIKDISQTSLFQIKIISFSRNFGKEVALTAGLQNCTGQAAILIDSDSQHPVSLIPEFIDKWEKGKRLVIGVRQDQKHTTFFDRLGSNIFYKVISLLSSTPIVPHTTDFRLLDRKVVDEFCRLTEHKRITRGLIDWFGFEAEYVYFSPNKRSGGEGSYKFAKKFHLAVSGVVSLSLFPLKIAGYLGVFIVFISTGLGVFVVLNKFFFGDPWGFHFSSASLLFILILFVTGLILISLGLISLYIANMYEQLIGRPMYVIKDIFSTDGFENKSF